MASCLQLHIQFTYLMYLRTLSYLRSEASIDITCVSIVFLCHTYIGYKLILSLNLYMRKQYLFYIYLIFISTINFKCLIKFLYKLVYTETINLLLLRATHKILWSLLHTCIFAVYRYLSLSNHHIGFFYNPRK